MRISDWSSDVSSSDLLAGNRSHAHRGRAYSARSTARRAAHAAHRYPRHQRSRADGGRGDAAGGNRSGRCNRSEEHTSELQSLMRISYAVFCLKNKTEEKPSDSISLPTKAINTKATH